MKTRLIVILFVYLIIHPEYFLAQNIITRHYTRNEGLPSIALYKMIQDKDGFIWFGSDAGVTRFDGKSFINFTVEDGLSDNSVLVVKNDSKGRIWFLGLNGTVSYWYDGKIYNENNDTILKKITSPNPFIDLYEDDQNRLWFTAQYEYILVDQGKVRKIQAGEFSHIGVIFNAGKNLNFLTSFESFESDAQVIKMLKLELPFKINAGSGYCHLKDKSIIFVSKEGFVHQKNRNQKLIMSFPENLGNVWCPSLAITKDSLLYAAFMGKGLYCYNLKEPYKEPVIYFENMNISGVLSDREYNIWVGTRNDGLYLIPEWANDVQYLNKSNGLFDDFCQTVIKPDKKNLIVGYDKGVLQLINNKIKSIIIQPDYESSFNIIHKMLDYENVLWVATDDGLVCYDLKTGHYKVLDYKENGNLYTTDNIKDICFGKNKLYAAGSSNIFEYSFDNNEINSGLSIIRKGLPRVYSVFCDKSERIWYSSSLGLQSMKNDDIFLHINDDPLLKNRINCFVETDDSVMVLATHGFGLLFYKHGKIIQQVTKSDGLCNNICRKLFLYQNRIYISTPSGVSILNYSKGKASVYQNLDREYLLPCDDVYDVFADKEEIIIATLNGLAIISQKNLEKRKRNIPLLHITEIKFKDSLIYPKGTLVFPYYKNRITLSFIGINYLNPNKVNYRYRLKDDQPWELTSNNNLEFPKLKAGHYSFQVQARVGDGEWSPVKSFTFTINPPFWNSILFRIGVIVVCFLIGYVILKLYQKGRIRKLEEKQKIEKQIADLEQQALQTMLNPHFIFNVINSIQALINTNDKLAANRYLTDFAMLIRTNLELSYKRYISLEEELEYLKLYMKFENMRLNNKINFQIIPDIKIDESEVQIPVMMIQPLLENAIIHGIMPLNITGTIRLSYNKLSDKLIKVSVEDNGQGIDPSYIDRDLKDIIDESHALSMTIHRLVLFGKSAGQQFHLRFYYVFPDKANKGTIAEIILPLC